MDKATIQRALDAAVFHTEPFEKEGRLADYIPELATVDPDRFGAAIVNLRGASYLCHSISSTVICLFY